MGANQSKFSSFFSRKLQVFEKNNFFLLRKQFLERAFIEALRRLLVSYKEEQKNFHLNWGITLDSSIDQIYSVRAEVVEFLHLLKTETILSKLSQNQIFRLVLEKCHGDSTFTLNFFSKFKISRWSHENVEIFFRYMSDVLMDIFEKVFDSNVLRPNLLNLEEFHKHFDVRLELEDHDNYNANIQTITLKEMLTNTFEKIFIHCHYPKERNLQNDPSYLSASNGTKFLVPSWFSRQLDQFWIDNLLICGIIATSKKYSHDELVAWADRTKRLE